MRYSFPQRRTPAGPVFIELANELPGTYEIIGDKYFLAMTSIREEMEDKLGDLRVADVTMRIFDGDRKFRSEILTNGEVLVKVMLGSHRDQSLFYGYANRPGRKSKDKSDLLDLSAFSPLSLLADVPVADLYTWLKDQGHEVTKYKRFDTFRNQPQKAIRLRDVLRGIARKCGCADVLVEHYWTFKDALYPTITGGFDRLFVYTDFYWFPGDVRGGMFSSDLETFPNSFVRYENCKALLKYLCQMFFAIAFVQYDPLEDKSYLVFKQRGSSGADVTADGRLLDQETDYVTTRGVIVKHLLGRPGATFNSATMQSHYGAFDESDSLMLELSLKTHETPDSFGSGTADGVYAYLHIELPASDPDYPLGLDVVGHTVAHRFPTFGLNAIRLHKALAESYGRMHVGEKERLLRTYHGIRGIKGGISSVSNYRIGEVHSFVHEGALRRMDISATEINPFKNVSKVTGIPR